jgi:hypothetical protein
MKITLSDLLQNPDRTLSVFGMVFSFCLAFLGLSLHRPIPILIGVLIFVSCSVWLLLRTCDIRVIDLPVSGLQVKFWAILYFFLFILTMLVFYLRSNLYERPVLYFLLIALMAGVIACEIISSEKKYSGFILLQVILLGMNIASTQLLITPGLVGIDPWSHYALTRDIIRDAFIPLGDYYSKLPMFHLMSGATSLVSALPYKFATLFSISLGQIACIAIFVFLLGNYLFENHRIGLLASLLVIISDLNIRMSYWSIPNAFGALFIVIVLSLLFIRQKKSPIVVVAIPAILIMGVIILTHVIVAMCMAILLFIAWAVPYFYQKFYGPNQDYIPFLIPVGFTFAMIVWWNYMTDNVNNLASFIASGFSLPHMADYILVTTGSPLEIIIQLIFSSLGQNLFLTISIIGLLYMVSRKGNISTFSLAVIACTPLLFVFITYLLNSEIIGYRWLFISEILLSIPLALALYLVSGAYLQRSQLRYLFFLAVIGSLCFFMVMGANGNDDNHFLIPKSTLVTSEYYTEAELTGSNFFAASSSGKIFSDEDYAYNPSSSIFENVYGIPPGRLGILNFAGLSSPSVQENSIFIIRYRYISGIQNKRMPSQPDLYSYISDSQYNKIYENSALTGFGVVPA